MVTSRVRLVVFDVEGVVIETRSDIIFNKGGHFLYKLAKKSGLRNLLLLLFYGFLYKLNIINLRKVLVNVVKSLRGLDKNILLETYHTLHLKPGALETFNILKRNGIKIALVSSGVPNLVLQKLAEDLGADFYDGLDIEIRERTLTGVVLNSPYIEEGKIRAIQRYCEKESINLSETAAVGDDATNILLFKGCGMRIGINPDRKLSEVSDTILYKRRLTSILPLILMDEHYLPETREVERKDWIRNIIHSTGILTILLTLWIGEPATVLLILAVTILFSISELFRLNDLHFPFFTKITRTVARFSELPSLVATPIYFALGIMASYILFPRPISFATVALFTMGDSVANIVGRKLGKTLIPYNKEKTLEGSMAGFVAALLVASIFVPLPYALLGATVALFVESLPIEIDDNILIPIISGATIFIAMTL